MDALMQALQFTSDDLAANRRGEIGPFQVVRLKRALVRALAIGVPLLALGILAAAALMFLGDRQQSSGLTLVGIALTVFNAAVVGFLLQWWLRTRADLDRPVTATEGVLHRTVRARPNGRLIGYVLKLEGQPFEWMVNRTVFNAFPESAVCRLYRAAGSRQLLSAEVINGG
jgi:hypothetical protein